MPRCRRASARELDELVLRLRLAGKSDSEIARELRVVRRRVWARAERAQRRLALDQLPRPVARLVQELLTARRLLGPPRRSATLAAAVAAQQDVAVATVIDAAVRDLEAARAGLAEAAASLVPALARGHQAPH